MSDETFGAWLKARRIERGLTQVELEHDAELSQKYVSAAERGRVKLPDPETRERIHKALRTSEDDLVDVGLLTRLDFDGGVVYVNPRNIPDGDRAAEAAHRAIELDPPRAGDRHAGLRTHLAGYNLTQRQITALLAVLDAFTDDDQ